MAKVLAVKLTIKFNYKSMTKITFKRPIFSCKTHQEIFFDRLRALPTYNCVIGTDFDITLLLKDPIDKLSIEELTNIFNHWAIDLNSLADLIARVDNV